MNEPSPLVPQGSFESQAKRKSHVRIAVFSILAIHVVVLGGLLILGCKRDDKGGETEDPLDDVVGGAVAGDFTTATSPTGEQIEGHITDACIDVLTHFASGVVPEDSEDAARRAATLKAALAVEISSFNASSAEQSPYLQLRIDADQAMNSLIATAQMRDLFAEERPE